MSGFTINYTDSSSNLNLPNAYVQISNISYLPNYMCRVIFNVFLDQQNYENGKTSIFPNQ
jgi:hypothetical protein